MPIPILTDARSLNGGTGVSTYARGLAAALPHLTDQPLLLKASTTNNRAVRWLNAVSPRTRPLVYDAMGSLSARDVFRNAHVHFSTWGRLLRLSSDLPPGIAHWTYPVPLVLDGWINLYTVHDAIPLDAPELTSIDPRRHRAVLDRIQQEAARLVTVSDSARVSIVTALGCAPDFVVNAGQAVDVTDTPRMPIPAALRRKGYLLVVGSIEPRKNVAKLLAGYRASGTTLPLVLAGPDGWQAEPILREIRATPGAVRLPYQTRGELLGLIEGARALLFPSLAEGFGLPVIEAMALGTAVMTSELGALAEVAGGAARLVNPHDITSMAAAIEELSRNDAMIDALGSAGLVRADAFTANRFVEGLRSLYVDALRGTRPQGRGKPLDL
ncbi:glycosyltransferase family 1 protein [Sphingomonas sp. PP-F2F-G114-C0414]|uniref:glycosyltransferase family 4 protein n=1 Tax=Sphingomonas sp. PP-F2F-G114-C0414 TaxID=2135662 RepID=UPI0011C3A8C4|nr:glycosyltransferase family 1 protein [Sphingomonas sp. PP-F2F-G114-C0414]